MPTQRRAGKANRRNYPGRHHHHGLHFLALPDEKGCLIWISAARPGRVHDIAAARHDTSWRTCAPPASAPSRTSASAAWTTTYATP
ncbi:transposase family protein [Streptomyces sp. NPDC014892]|uniref:transposase family protein n=1 Tax=Streptomyces sp. NPDC014892 TaxID=3364930 RepID=UPI0036F5EF48